MHETVSKSDSIDLYQVLEVSPGASQADIRRSYFRLAKLYHPDLSVDADSEENTEHFLRIQEAYEVLSNTQKRLEYDESRRQGKSTREATSQAEQQSRPKPRPAWLREPTLEEIRDARKAFARVERLIEQEDYERAAEVLRVIVKTVPNEAEYQSMYGYVLAMVGDDLHKARDLCRRAVQMEPYSADYHAHLGFVYLQAGLRKTAQECFSTALTYDPSHPLARVHVQGEKSKGGLLGKLSSLLGH